MIYLLSVRIESDIRFSRYAWLPDGGPYDRVPASFRSRRGWSRALTIEGTFAVMIGAGKSLGRTLGRSVAAMVDEAAGDAPWTGDVLDLALTGVV